MRFGIFTLHVVNESLGRLKGLGLRCIANGEVSVEIGFDKANPTLRICSTNQSFTAVARFDLLSAGRHRQFERQEEFHSNSFPVSNFSCFLPLILESALGMAIALFLFACRRIIVSGSTAKSHDPISSSPAPVRITQAMTKEA